MQAGVYLLELAKVAPVVFEISGDEGVGIAVAGGAGLLVELNKISGAGNDLWHKVGKFEVVDAADGSRVCARGGCAAEADDHAGKFVLVALDVRKHALDGGVVFR